MALCTTFFTFVRSRRLSPCAALFNDWSLFVDLFSSRGFSFFRLAPAPPPPPAVACLEDAGLFDELLESNGLLPLAKQDAPLGGDVIGLFHGLASLSGRLFDGTVFFDAVGGVTVVLFFAAYLPFFRFPTSAGLEDDRLEILLRPRGLLGPLLESGDLLGVALERRGWWSFFRGCSGSCSNASTAREDKTEKTGRVGISERNSNSSDTQDSSKTREFWTNYTNNTSVQDKISKLNLLKKSGSCAAEKQNINKRKFHQHWVDGHPLSKNKTPPPLCVAHPFFNKTMGGPYASKNNNLTEGKNSCRTLANHGRRITQPYKINTGRGGDQQNVRFVDASRICWFMCLRFCIVFLLLYSSSSSR